MGRANVLLVVPPPLNVDHPHLGVAYLASSLKKNNINVSVLDLNLDFYKRANKKELWEFNSFGVWRKENSFKKMVQEYSDVFDEYSEKIANHKADIIGFSIIAPNFLFCFELAKRIKKKNKSKKIIFGGIGLKEYLRQTLGLDYSNDNLEKVAKKHILSENVVDYFVIGEAEKSFSELAKKIQRPFGRFFAKNVPGVLILKKGEFSYKEPRQIKDLDSLPFPTYENFNLSDYFSDKSRYLPLVMGRGCKHRCQFCNECVYYPKYITRSAEHMFREIKYHVKENKVREFSFVDSSISNNKKEFEQLLNKIIDSGIKISWSALVAMNYNLDYNFFKKMKKAGCTGLVFGMESGSDNVLKLMKKPHRVKLAETILEDSKKAGINNNINLIVGYPGETEEDFQKTLEFLEKNKKNIDCVSSLLTLHVVHWSSLAEKLNQIGMKLGNNKEFGYINWSMDSPKNTYKIRIKRLKKVEKLLDKLGIKYFNNVLDLELD